VRKTTGQTGNHIDPVHTEVVLTGTFFCDRTTAQFLPRTPRDVIFAAVMALKAYSIVWQKQLNGILDGSAGHSILTNLVQSPLVREDRDMSVIGAS
jgi:hypothetical protein